MKKAGVIPTDSGWNEWDIQIYGNFWWSIALQTVTEYHGGGKCLTRVRLRNRLVTTTDSFSNLIAVSLLIYRQLNVSPRGSLVHCCLTCSSVFLWTRARTEVTSGGACRPSQPIAPACSE